MPYEVDARELYEALARCEGAQTYETIVAPWLDQAQSGYRAWLATAGGFGSWWAEKETEPEGQHLVRELYALHRVSDRLLLTFQPPSGEPRSPDPLPSLSEGEYLDAFTSLGMSPFRDGDAFDPFLHEIAEVEQADDPHAPIEITEVLWPGLMLGRLLFNRSGVRIRAGVEHAQRGVADRSPLYWSFLRRHRPTVDLSQGWGSNSQWRTDFRLDYRTPAGDRLNVTGNRPIDGNADLHPDHPNNLSPEERLLTPGVRRELLRHRCLLRMPEAADALAGSPGWERDLMPFGWRLPGSDA
ncbi:hypothetical protein JGS39_27785 [Streptomyces sp. P01-B04]|uniref:hypothetical protein n=1 Tax=Streptomyces poriferorum TaxID=2798799 RepID=UPI001C5E49DD|nr:hypothetical protein [Streptomyces poriferorum]MBW5252744.1 hypothetical protein [Streptomyces poriferorum]MBW5259710.1 hypothetical protein [Streptomyces poriferorum]